MTRYYEDENRIRNHKMAVEHHEYVTIEQLRDILQLVEDKKWPDGNYGDFECNVWSVLMEYWPEMNVV